MNFINDVLEVFGYQINKDQEDKFEQYFNKLIDYNKKTNLTAITERSEVYYKHFFDSISSMMLVNYTKDELHICDIGAGAGFPSIPLKILFPNLKIDIVDSLNKRIIFLEELIEELELDNIGLFHDRIEKFALGHLNKYDIVTARALGKLNMISEMALPMLKKQGQFIAYKGSEVDKEIIDSSNALDILGGTIIETKNFNLPNNYGARNLILISKTKNVKGYPRDFASMKKKPL